MSNARRAQQSSSAFGGGAVQSQFNRTQLASTFRPQVNDARSFDRTMGQRRDQQTVQDALQGFHAVNSRVMAINESDARVETMRRMRRFQQQNAELAQAYALETQLREREQRKMLTDQDQQLAAAMSHLKNEEIAREQNHRRICDESEELTELRSMLKAAQMNKARATQLTEKAIIESNHKERNARMEAEMEADRQAALQLEQAELERRQFLNMQSRGVLQGQMAEKELAKQLAYEQFLKEKAIVDSVVASIEADDAEKMKMQLSKQKELQENIRTYLEERSLWRAEEKKRAEYELRKIQEYQQLQESRHQELMRQKKNKTDAADKVLEKITAEIEAKKREEEAMQNLLYELYQEEAESKALAEIRAREEKINKMRRDMVEANEYQKAYKQQKRMNQQREEDAFRVKMMEKFAEDKRLENLNLERRRREVQEYKNEVEAIIQERKALYEQSVEQELAARRAEQQEMEYKLQVVERERQRLLEEYARDLRDWLPKGVFRTEEDYVKVFDRPPTAGHIPLQKSQIIAQQQRDIAKTNAKNMKTSNIRF
jgi:hypothetical protein